MCNGCNCVNCQNNSETQAARNAAIDETLARNPKAFQAKIESTGDRPPGGGDDQRPEEEPAGEDEGEDEPGGRGHDAWSLHARTVHVNRWKIVRRRSRRPTAPL